MLDKLVFSYTQEDLIQMAGCDAFKKAQEMLGRGQGEKLVCKQKPKEIGEKVEFILEVGD